MDDQILSQVLQECFCGDYIIPIELARQKLIQEDPDFERLLASHIVANSSFPSGHLRAVFGLEKLHRLLEDITTTGRAERRRTLARALLFNQVWECEPKWIRQ